MSATNADRLYAIRDALLPHVNALFSANLDKMAAQEASNTASAGFTSLREGLALTMAHASHTNAWSVSDSASGLKLAIDGCNLDKPKSIAQFVSEMNSAMNPAVREWLPTFCAITTEVEAQEKEDAKAELPTPVKKAFARRWHVITALMAQAKDGNYIGTVERLRTFAEQRDPDLNAERQAKALDTMKASLLTIFANFPDDSIKEAVDSLASITAQSLLAARIKMVPAPVVPTVDRVVAEASVPGGAVTVGEAPADRVSDAVSELLGLAA